MTDAYQQREREIVQLQRQIEAKGTPGFFGFLLRYLGVIAAILLSLIGVAVFDLWDIAVFGYAVLLIGYPIYWMVERTAQNNRKARLKKLLREEGREIDKEVRNLG